MTLERRSILLCFLFIATVNVLAFNSGNLSKAVRLKRSAPRRRCRHGIYCNSRILSPQFPLFPATLDDMSVELAGSLADAARNVKAGPQRMRLDLRLGQLQRDRRKGALAKSEDFLMLDLIRGVAQNLAVRGFTKVRVMFNTRSQALSARKFLMNFNPMIIRIDALGTGTAADDDELILVVRPNNCREWTKIDHLQKLMTCAAVRGISVALINPELASITNASGIVPTRCRPMLLGDCSTIFCIDPAVHVLSSSVHLALLRRYPRPWELYCRDLRQPELGYLYFAQHDVEPTFQELTREFAMSGIKI